MAIFVDPLRADWGLAVSMDTIWETDISLSRQDGIEERRSMIRYPRRSLNFRISACSPLEVWRMVNVLKRSSEDRLIVPLVQDQMESGLTSSGTSINIDEDTSTVRLFVNHPFVISSADGQTFESGIIDTFTPTGFTSVDPLANVYGPGHRVFPAIEAEINLNQQPGGVLTDGIVQQQLTLRERVQDSSLPPRVAEHQIRDGTIFSTYDVVDGLPVLPSEPDYSASFRLQLPRIGDRIPSGFGEIVNVRALIPRFSWTERLRFCSRAEWDRIFAFYSARRGRALPFWAVLPIALWRTVAVAPGQVDVEPCGDLLDIGWLTHFGAVGPDGSKFVTEILSKSDLGSVWRFTLADSLPAGWTEDTMRYTTAAVRSRFARDSFREIWDTDDLPRVSLEIMSLVNEQDFGTSIPGVTVAGGSAVVSLEFVEGGIAAGGSAVLSALFPTGPAGGAAVVPAVAP